MKQAELVTFHRTLEQTYPIYASLRFPTPCTLEQARACLDDDEVGLVYLTGASRSYLVVLTKMPTDRPAIHELPAVAVISELINALTDETNLGRETKTRRLGAEAYQMLLALAAPAIAGKHLVIVAGGALGLLPFELLVEPGADGRGHFLVEGRRIRYAPSFTTLHVNALWDAKRRRPDRPLFALGNPVYRPADFAAATGDPADVFAPLPASALEVERIRNLMAAKPDDVLVGASASEHRLKALSCAAMLARYRYLHFASHGLLGLSEGRQPSLVLTQAGDLEGEDGFLRLDEVTGLHLNADLVVLSACRTGQGRSYNAEGVSGLARGFLFAGSRGVVCSLWRVSDQPTSEWMSELYQSLKSGQAAPEAVRTARLRRLAAGEPPLHWAPFVLIGR